MATGFTALSSRSSGALCVWLVGGGTPAGNALSPPCRAGVNGHRSQRMTWVARPWSRSRARSARRSGDGRGAILRGVSPFPLSEGWQLSSASSTCAWWSSWAGPPCCPETRSSLRVSGDCRCSSSMASVSSGRTETPGCVPERERRSCPGIVLSVMRADVNRGQLVASGCAARAVPVGVRGCPVLSRCSRPGRGAATGWLMGRTRDVRCGRSFLQGPAGRPA
jgi:hypothetical protein